MHSAMAEELQNRLILNSDDDQSHDANDNESNSTTEEHGKE